MNTATEYGRISFFKWIPLALFLFFWVNDCCAQAPVEQVRSSTGFTFHVFSDGTHSDTLISSIEQFDSTGRRISLKLLWRDNGNNFKKTTYGDNEKPIRSEQVLADGDYFRITDFKYNSQQDMVGQIINNNGMTYYLRIEPEYNMQGKLSKNFIIGPDSTVQGWNTLTYDKSGNLISKTDFIKGDKVKVQRLKYDKKKQVVEECFEDLEESSSTCIYQRFKSDLLVEQKEEMDNEIQSVTTFFYSKKGSLTSRKINFPVKKSASVTFYEYDYWE